MLHPVNILFGTSHAVTDGLTFIDKSLVLTYSK